MLTFFMWVIGVTFNASDDVVLISQSEFQQKYTPADFSHFQTVDLEEGEYVTVELEPELKIELDMILIPTK